MKIKVKDKEFSFEGYVFPINSVQRVAERCYEQGRADKYQEIVSEYMLLTEEQVNQIRADERAKVIDNLLSQTDHLYNDVYSFTIDELVKLKGADNDNT